MASRTDLLTNLFQMEWKICWRVCKPLYIRRETCMPQSFQTDSWRALCTSSLPQKERFRCFFERQTGIWQTPFCVIPNRKSEPPPKRWVSCLPTFDKTLLTNSRFAIISSIMTGKCSSEPIQASNSLQLLLKLMSQAINCKWVLFSNWIHSSLHVRCEWMR